MMFISLPPTLLPLSCVRAVRDAINIFFNGKWRKYAKDHHQKSFSSLAVVLNKQEHRRWEEGNKNGKSFHRMNIFQKLLC